MYAIGKAMEEILSVVDALTPLHEKLVAAAANLDFSYVCDLPNQTVVESQTYHGIYKIDVGTDSGTELAAWIDNFRGEWDLAELHQSFTCTTKDKRIKKHAVLLQWMPLYIGKSKNVAQRVAEHWRLPMKARTFALKISGRPNMRNRRFRLSTIRLPKENYDYIAPVVERTLRDRLNPLVGKQ
jgi:hypothetical protein